MQDALGPAFCAYEGPDYFIHPDPDPTSIGHLFGERYYFELTGPAREAVEEKLK